MVGETIGSYRVLQQLGQGGMGAVYLAEHRHLHRKAAIKVLLKEFVARPDLLDRFFAEARATSVIEHPGIVQIFDCEVDADGRPYIVMEFLGGETLAGTLQRQGPLAPSEAAAYARCMAEALAAAHDKGIIHRDIKPDNVFVRPGPPPSAKLVDFGIAKLAGEFHAGLGHRTQTGIVMGTPLYMSPEQCRGAGKVDYRTDIYSLGCVLFEMLAGRPPFVQEGAGELVAAHLTQAPPELTGLVSGLSPDLSDLVGRMLRKQAEERPQTMREVADRLAGSFRTAKQFTPDGPAASGQAAAARPAGTPPSGTAPAMTTLRGTASEIRALDDGDLTVPRRRAGPVVALLGLVGVIAGGWWWSRQAPRGVDGPAAEAPPSAPAPIAGPAPAAPPVAGSVPAAAASGTPAALPPAAAAPPPGPAGSPASSEAPRQRRPRPRAAASAVAPPAVNTPARIELASDPPGATVCLDDDRRTLGKTPQVLHLPRDGRQVKVLLQLTGFQVKELSLKADRDLRRAVSLDRLGADDLAPAAVCH